MPTGFRVYILLISQITQSWNLEINFDWSEILAGLEAFDVANILTQQGGEALYPLPRIKDLLVHSKLNLAICLLTVDINAF